MFLKFGNKIFKIFSGLLLITLAVSSSYTQSIFTNAQVVCDTTNGFSYDGTSCSKTTTSSKICNSSRNFPSTNYHSSTATLNGNNCEVQKIDTVVTQDTPKTYSYASGIEKVDLNGVTYLLSLAQNTLELQQINSNLSTFSTSSQVVNYRNVVGVTGNYLSNIKSFRVGSAQYFLLIRSAAGSGYLGEVYKWNGTNFLFTSSFNTNSYGYSVTHYNIGSETFMGVGPEIYKFNSTTETFNLQQTTSNSVTYSEGKFAKLGNDEFYIATGYGNGDYPTAYKYNTQTGNWNYVYTFPNPIVPAGTPGRVFAYDFGTSSTSNYPQGAYVTFSHDAYNGYTWNGTSFVSVSTNASPYSPFSSISPYQFDYRPSQLVSFKDYNYIIGTDYGSNICTSNFYSHNTTGQKCVKYPNGSSQSNLNDSPTDNEIIVSGDQIYVYSIYSYAGRAGIVASTRLKTESYPAVCSSAFVFNTSSNQCEKIEIQNSGVKYQLQSSDLSLSPICTPVAILRSETTTCKFQINSNVPTTYPFVLPQNGATTAKLETENTAKSSPCTVESGYIECANIPVSDLSSGEPKIVLEIYGEANPLITQIKIKIIEIPNLISYDLPSLVVGGGERITLTGSNFESGTIVTIGGELCTDLIFTSSTQISCVSPPRSVGEQEIVVKNPLTTVTSHLAINYVDGDMDVLPNEVENTVGNNGDGNNDGLKDYLQTNVLSSSTSLPSVTLATQVENCSRVDNYELLQGVANATEDINYKHVSDMIGIRVQCVEGGSVRITQYYYGLDMNKDYIYRKYGPLISGDASSIGWYTMPGTTITKENINGYMVVKAEMTIEDGGIGDDTGVDSVILDPGVLSTLATNSNSGNSLLNNSGGVDSSILPNTLQLIRTGGQ
jgi:hypothetical protein